MRLITIIFLLSLSLTLLWVFNASGVSKPVSEVAAGIEDKITCEPQKDTSENLWTCQDYYKNTYSNLIITQKVTK